MSAAIERDRHGPSSGIGLRRLLSSVSARDISRALIRRQGPPPEETTRLSVFGYGQDTCIQNSTVNTTVHYHYATRAPLDGSTAQIVSQQNHAESANGDGSGLATSASSAEIDFNRTTQASSPDKASAPRDAREVYADIMITKNRGFPLWIPSPNISLPPEYRHSGVSIGDVGILTPEGGFDFIFNIFAQANDPINANSGLANNFSPLRPPLLDYEVQRFKENIAGTSLSDDSFKRSDHPPNVTLSTTASEAAVLIMPENVYVVKIQNQERLRAYVTAHIATWYAFVRRILGRDVGNGDLRVVYGYRKSTAFGIAAVSTTQKPTETRLLFRENEAWARQLGYKYLWRQVGTADINTGPEYTESAELMYPAYGTSRRLPENQCLFISTVDVKLSAQAWRSMEAISVPFSDTTPSEGFAPSSRHPAGHSQFEYSGGSGGQPSKTSSTQDLPTQFFWGKSSISTIHPSGFLNDVLLETNPGAAMSIICDDDWQDYMHCRNPLEFVTSILFPRTVIIENNVVYLERPITNVEPLPHLQSDHHSAANTIPFDVKSFMSGVASFMEESRQRVKQESEAKQEPESKQELGVKPESEINIVGDFMEDMARLEIDKTTTSKPEVTLLLLGQSEAGKSTIVKQFQLLHSPDAFSLERLSYRPVVYFNLVRSVRRILSALSPDPDPYPLADLFTQHPSPRYVPPATRRTPSIKALHVEKYDHYRRRLEPLAALEEKLLALLPSQEGEAMGSAPLRPRYEDGSDYNKSVVPSVILSQNSSSAAKALPRTHTFATDHTPAPIYDKGADTHTSRDWDNLRESEGSKGLHAEEIRSWWADPDDPIHVLNACGPTMLEMWRDAEVQLVLQAKRPYPEEMSGFFFEDIPRIIGLKYIPSNTDVLKCRLQTTGIVEHNFSMTSPERSGVQWRIYDVGGARDQRASWASYFERVNAIIFLAPISAFDQVLAEDPRVNRLDDSLTLWQTVVSNKLLANVSMLLFLNKCDLLKTKLEAGMKLKDYILTYGDRPNDYSSIVKYFKLKFTAIHEKYTSNKGRDLHTYITAMTDIARSANIISSVRDTIVTTNLHNITLV